MELNRLRYSTKLAQHALNISNWKFWKLVSAGRLKLHYDGSRAYVTHDELRRYIESLSDYRQHGSPTPWPKSVAARALRGAQKDKPTDEVKR